MNYLILIAIAVIVLILIFQQIRKRSRQNLVEKIRANWGKPREEYFYFDRIAKYTTLNDRKHFHHLGDQTIFDIDFHNLFIYIDRTTSRIGQQYLYNQLLHPGDSEDELKRFNKLVNLFSENASLREEIQVALSSLSTHEAYTITSLLHGNMLEKPSWFRKLPWSVAALVTSAALSFLYPAFIVLALILASFHIIIHYWNKTGAFEFGRALPQLIALINSAAYCCKQKETSRSDIPKSIDLFRSFQRKMTLLNLNEGSGIKGELAQLTSYAAELLKGIFLIEVFTVFNLAQNLQDKKAAIRNIFEYVGDIDAAISVASLRAGAATCTPRFNAAKKYLSAKAIRHPLIENCVINDISIEGKGILITGSNMSGKTTFLRTLMINSLLAQTIYTCFAGEFVSPFLKPFSSIRIDDSLLEAKSYFLEEVSVVSGLLRESVSGNQNLFVLDEVFKGTNTTERVAAAKAILAYLNSENNIVVVSTHDLELAELLMDQFDLYHFTETIDESDIQFDHKLRHGPLTSANALRMLERSNFPAQILAEANDLIAKRRPRET